MMKKFAFSLIGMLFVLLIGCSNEDMSRIGEKSDYNIKSDLVSLTVKEGTLTETKATFMLENHTDGDYMYGGLFLIEKEIKGVWHAFKPEREISFTAQAYRIETGSSIELPVEWEYGYGKLSTGKYRLVKSVFLDIYGTSNDVYIAAEFTVK